MQNNGEKREGIWGEREEIALGRSIDQSYQISVKGGKFKYQRLLSSLSGLFLLLLVSPADATRGLRPRRSLVYDSVYSGKRISSSCPQHHSDVSSNYEIELTETSNTF